MQILRRGKFININHENTDLLFVRYGDSLRFVGMTPQGPQSIRKYNGSIDFKMYREVELHASGENQSDLHGRKFTGGNPGLRLKYEGMKHTSTEYGYPYLPNKMPKGSEILSVVHYDSQLGLRVVSKYLFVPSISLIRRWTEILNEGKEAVGIETVSSAVINGIGLGGSGHWTQRISIYLAKNSWQAEAQWECYRGEKTGIFVGNNDFNIGCCRAEGLGSWSTAGWLPMGVIEDSGLGCSYVWQIEHNGSWCCEIADMNPSVLYLFLSGPNEQLHQWWKRLMPGEKFVSVPVAIGVVKGGFSEAVEALTKYRRVCCLKPHSDNKTLPVVFNDYMNCLGGDPTTAKEKPLIVKAAQAGCEYYTIDSGWYAAKGESWWPTVGNWTPGKGRFPGGIERLFDFIRKNGMIPGLWLEIEVAGIDGPLSSKPDSWFFMRHQKRVKENSRYLLDFRNPQVREFADEVIDRVVKQYGCGYIKMDYNVNALMGSETNADSFGDGLLQHNRAYLAWIDSVFERYPNLVIENCGSGGMRLDYAMLSRHQIQSSSDQSRYFLYPSILASEACAVLPEQMAVWSYPMAGKDVEETVFNMVNSMLSRIHLSGHLDKLSKQQFALVREGIETYKRIRTDIPYGYPILPMGFRSIMARGGSYCYALNIASKKLIYLALWKFDGKENVISIPLSRHQQSVKRMSQIYPGASSMQARLRFRKEQQILEVEINGEYGARLFEINY